MSSHDISGLGLELGAGSDQGPQDGKRGQTVIGATSEIGTTVDQGQQAPGQTDREQALRGRIVYLEGELALMRERLRLVEETERIQTDFALAVSHELRTPLTLIRGYVQQLLYRWTTSEEVRRRGMVEKINVSSHRLARLVDDMLLITDVERGALPVVLKSVALPDIVASALEELRDRYPDGLPAIVIAGPPVWAIADGFRLEQVLISLLDNAVKHAPSASTVMLVWGEEDGAVVVKISDEGSGIDPADIPRLFTRFGRLERSLGQTNGGVGLGLYIARRLVEAMNGRIWVDSVRGSGSTFSVAVPIDNN